MLCLMSWWCEMRVDADALRRWCFGAVVSVMLDKLLTSCWPPQDVMTGFYSSLYRASKFPSATTPTPLPPGIPSTKLQTHLSYLALCFFETQSPSVSLRHITKVLADPPRSQRRFSIGAGGSSSSRTQCVPLNDCPCAGWSERFR